MKTRNGFVSNSSSSSFIVVGEKPPSNISSVALSSSLAKVLIDYNNARAKEAIGKWNEEYEQEIKWDGTSTVYLTEFVSDCRDDYDGGIGVRYMEGNHGTPYTEEGLVIIKGAGDYGSVYVQQEHYDAAFPKEEPITREEYRDIMRRIRRLEDRLE